MSGVEPHAELWVSAESWDAARSTVAPDVREWLTTHIPDAEPWQVEMVGAMITAQRQGRSYVHHRSRRYGMGEVLSMLRRWAAEHPGTDHPTAAVPAPRSGDDLDDLGRQLEAGGARNRLRLRGSDVPAVSAAVVC